MSTYYNFTGSVDQILEIIEEAKTRNYPEHVMKYDLNNFLIQLYRSQEEDFEKELKWAVESAEEETRDDCYSEAYDEGKEEGISEAREKFIEVLADKMIELKSNIQCNVLQGKDLQIALTELVLEMDEDSMLSSSYYGNKEQTLRDFDN